MTAFHFPLAASFAPVWGHCSAAIGLASLYPQSETEATREGTASHWFAEQVFTTGTVHPAGTVCPNGVVLTDEMIEAAWVFIDDVTAAMAQYRSEGMVGGAEFMTAAARIHPMCGGTVDYYLWIPARMRLISWNYKYGHRYVDAFENEQEMVYAAGLLDTFGIDGLAEQHVTFECRIVQPRCYSGGGSVRSWIVPATDLRAHWNQLSAHAVESFGPSPVATTGSHCYDCPAAHACEAHKKMTSNAIDAISRAPHEPPTPDSVSFELALLERAADAIKARRVAMDEHAKQLIRAGKVVPGWTMESTYGRLDWNVPTEAVTALGDAFGVDLRRPVEPITPTQAIKKLKGTVDDAVIKAYAARERTGMTLVKTDTAAIRRILTPTRS